ncbi:tagaturonate reductase, partial [Yersinia enterocolitica]
KLAELVNTVLSDTAHWGQDLTAVPQLANQVTEQLQTIIDSGMRAAVAAYS